MSNIRDIAPVVLAALLAGCSSDTYWQEEIATADGERIVLKRAESRWRFASSSLPGSGSPESQTLSASVPGVGNVVWEHDHTLSHPLAFDVVGGTPWLIVENDVPCEKNPTDEPLRIFRYAERKWTQVRMADAPARLEANLLRYSYAESRGDLGKRRYVGKCGQALQQQDDYRIPAFTWLRYSDHCGKALEELSRAALRNSRNCALRSAPRNPAFETQWRAYQQTPFREVAAQVASRGAPAPGFPPARAGIRNTYVGGGTDMFRCTIGCKEDVLQQVVAYRLQADSRGPLEFSLAEPGNRRFYAEAIARPALLVCDRQGFKMLHVDRASASDPYRVRAVVFDLAGNLAGKWSVTLPDQQSEPTLYGAAGELAFLYGFDVLESEVRVLIGRGAADMCSAGAAGAGTVVDLRAAR